jgi:hypothetical protein
MKWEFNRSEEFSFRYKKPSSAQKAYGSAFFIIKTAIFYKKVYLCGYFQKY